MPLTLTLQSPSAIAIEVEGFSPRSLRQLGHAEIGNLPLTVGNQQVACGDLFRIEGSAESDNSLIFSGNCESLHGIGAALSEGVIRVDGSAGRHLGAGMTAGEVIVSGDVGDWAGAEMHGGRIVVQGHAANQLGSAYRGARKGMTGGEIFVHQSAGHELGRSMRRGLIAIGQSAGEGLGHQMIAGTILVFGSVAAHPGAGMRRGTIALMDPARSPAMLPSFREAGRFPATFLQLYFRHLRKSEFPFSEPMHDTHFRAFRGDLLELGLGEILLAT
jgi:formylmethanofuran dehydrogenase subunit C